MAGIRQVSADEFDNLENQTTDNTDTDLDAQDTQTGQDDELSSPDYEKQCREVLGDETVDAYKVVMGKKGMDFTSENVAKMPGILQEQDKTITKQFQEISNIRKGDNTDTFQDISGPNGPAPPQQGQVDPFLAQFASDPKGTLKGALMGTLGELASMNNQKQQAAMELEDRMLETHPHAPRIMPTYNRLVARGIDPQVAWDRAEVAFWRSQDAGVMSRMGKNASRAASVHVEGSGGPTDVMGMGTPDFKTAEEQRAWLIKKGAFRE